MERNKRLDRSDDSDNFEDALESINNEADQSCHGSDEDDLDVLRHQESSDDETGLHGVKPPSWIESKDSIDSSVDSSKQESEIASEEPTNEEPVLEEDILKEQEKLLSPVELLVKCYNVQSIHTLAFDYTFVK